MCCARVWVNACVGVCACSKQHKKVHSRSVEFVRNVALFFSHQPPRIECSPGLRRTHCTIKYHGLQLPLDLISCGLLQSMVRWSISQSHDSAPPPSPSGVVLCVFVCAWFTSARITTTRQQQPPTQRIYICLDWGQQHTHTHRFISNPTKTDCKVACARGSKPFPRPINNYTTTHHKYTLCVGVRV